MASLTALFFWGDFLLPVRRSLLPNIFSVPSAEILQAENMALSVELAGLLSLKESVSYFTPNTLLAEVYSRYPFNAKNELTIAVGSVGGVKPGMAVLFNELLIGRVKETRERVSLVKTIFDPSFELSVKIGDENSNGLFKGGPNPQVTLIGKDTNVKSGSGVISANIDLPYGLPLGEISDIHDEAGKIWWAASLQIPYDLETVNVVSVITNFSYEK